MATNILTAERERIARQLADEVTARRNGLERDRRAISERGPRTQYARSAKDRSAELYRINGMIIALTYVLGKPLDMYLAEEFIKGSDVWRALL